MSWLLSPGWEVVGRPYSRMFQLPSTGPFPARSCLLHGPTVDPLGPEVSQEAETMKSFRNVWVLL